MKNIKKIILAFAALCAICTLAFNNAENSGASIKVESKPNPEWPLWKERGYNFGVDPKKVPVPVEFNSQIMTNSTIMVRGKDSSGKRWGYHCFEAYANDDKSRITMLVNKHVEEGKPVAELYYYGTVYNHQPDAYNWFRIGSDVRQHSFMFGRDKAIFYGSAKMTNALTLGNIGKDNIRKDKPKGDDEANHAEDAKFVNYTELKDGGNGTMFYDKDNDIVVVKVAGKWKRLVLQDLPENVKYEF